MIPSRDNPSRWKIMWQGTEICIIFLAENCYDLPAGLHMNSHVSSIPCLPTAVIKLVLWMIMSWDIAWLETIMWVDDWWHSACWSSFQRVLKIAHLSNPEHRHRSIGLTDTDGLSRAQLLWSSISYLINLALCVNHFLLLQSPISNSSTWNLPRSSSPHL